MGLVEHGVGHFLLNLVGQFVEHWMDQYVEHYVEHRVECLVKDCGTFLCSSYHLQTQESHSFPFMKIRLHCSLLMEECRIDVLPNLQVMIRRYCNIAEL